MNSARLIFITGLLLFTACSENPGYSQDSPNILLVITDDQSWLHTSWLGEPGVATPNFDRIAAEGVYFEHAYASSPSCTASRSSILAGQQLWELGRAAVLWGEFSDSLISYQQLLQEIGYHTGFTGKGWGPGRSRGNPAGPEFNALQLADSRANLSNLDYSGNFRAFLDARPAGAPFSYWFTPFEPHRPLANAAADETSLASVRVPPFLPDDRRVRRDLHNYYQEIAWQDQALGEMLDELEFRGQLENTLVIVTSDNGMPFPRAKATNYQAGVRVPLAMRWGARIEPRVVSEAIVNLSDLAPTILAAAGLPIPMQMSGRNLFPIIDDTATGEIRNEFGYTITGFERHIVNARAGNRTYPSRAVQTPRYTLIRNFAPERWPAGDPPLFLDIDATSPSRDVILADPQYAALATNRRPALELYALQSDPFQLDNRANDPELANIQQFLNAVLEQYLERHSDPLLTDGPDSFLDMPWYGPAPANPNNP